MIVTFFSSVLNHHQIEFCDEMYKILGDKFRFVSTMEMEKQRENLKYSEYDRPYRIKMHRSEKEREESNNLFQISDVVILGVNMPTQLRERLKKEKITFLYRERIFKEVPSVHKYLRSIMYFAKEYWRFRKIPFYLLAASAYTYQDHKALGMFKGKAFAWGYFPPCKLYDETILMNAKESKELKLFWAGRFIDWKNFPFVIEVAKQLREEKINFCIEVAGTGVLEEEMKKLVEKEKLQDYVTFHGAIPPDVVRRYMEWANIYLFTSNRQEGFGAVLTEAMNSGCAVVASATAGGTRLLIKDMENGLIYGNDSSQELCEKVLYLAKNQDNMRRIGINAYRTIRDIQNAKVAAHRFVKVVESMLSQKEIPQYLQGPMRQMR